MLHWWRVTRFLYKFKRRRLRDRGARRCALCSALPGNAVLQAKESQEAAEAIPELMDDDDAADNAKQEPTVEHGVPGGVLPKKESKRGVQVMPNPAASPDAGSETPSWLKNLKNRTSQKKPQLPPPPLSPARDDEAGAAETPSWLSNLKKSKSSTQILTPASKPSVHQPQHKPETLTAANHGPAAAPNHVPARPPPADKAPSAQRPRASTKTETDAEV